MWHHCESSRDTCQVARKLEIPLPEEDFDEDPSPLVHLLPLLPRSLTRLSRSLYYAIDLTPTNMTHFPPSLTEMNFRDHPFKTLLPLLPSTLTDLTLFCSNNGY